MLMGCLLCKMEFALIICPMLLDAILNQKHREQSTMFGWEKRKSEHLIRMIVLIRRQMHLRI